MSTLRNTDTVLGLTSSSSDFDSNPLVPVIITLDFDPVDFQEACTKGITTYKCCEEIFYKWKEISSKLKRKILLNLDKEILKNPAQFCSEADSENYRESARIKILISAIEEFKPNDKVSESELRADRFLRVDLKIAAFRLYAIIEELIEQQKVSKNKKLKQIEESTVTLSVSNKKFDESISSLPRLHRSMPLITFTYECVIDNMKSSKSLQLFLPSNSRVNILKSKDESEQKEKLTSNDWIKEEDENKNEDLTLGITLFPSTYKFSKARHKIFKSKLTTSANKNIDKKVDKVVLDQALLKLDCGSGNSDRNNKQSSTCSLGEIRENEEDDGRKKLSDVVPPIVTSKIFCNIVKNSKLLSQCNPQVGIEIYNLQSNFENNNNNGRRRNLSGRMLRNPRFVEDKEGNVSDELDSKSKRKNDSHMKELKNDDENVNLHAVGSKEKSNHQNNEIVTTESESSSTSWDTESEESTDDKIRRPNLNTLDKLINRDLDLEYGEFGLKENPSEVHHKNSRLVYCIFFGAILLTLVFTGIVVLCVEYYGGFGLF